MRHCINLYTILLVVVQCSHSSFRSPSWRSRPVRLHNCSSARRSCWTTADAATAITASAVALPTVAGCGEVWRCRNVKLGIINSINNRCTVLPWWYRTTTVATISCPQHTTMGRRCSGTRFKSWEQMASYFLLLEVSSPAPDPGSGMDSRNSDRIRKF